MCCSDVLIATRACWRVHCVRAAGWLGGVTSQCCAETISTKHAGGDGGRRAVGVRQRSARSTRPQRQARHAVPTRVEPHHLAHAKSPPLPLADPGSRDSGRGPLHLGPKMRLRLVKGTRTHTHAYTHTHTHTNSPQCKESLTKLTPLKPSHFLDFYSGDWL